MRQTCSICQLLPDNSTSCEIVSTETQWHFVVQQGAGLVHSQDVMQGVPPGGLPLELQHFLPFSVCIHSSQFSPLCMPADWNDFLKGHA